ncbi:MAG: DUF3445 domain-containing protein [Acidimicrobiales bacterium]
MVDYVPFDDRPFRLRMGLRPLDLAQWLEPDEHRDAELELKARLVRERHDDVVSVVDRPEVHAAATELLALLAAAQGEVAGPESLHPIARCGMSTQEDWCLLVPVDGELVLAAACVCFPTRWVLATKIGLPMGGVHEHVAFYADHLGRTVDGFFDRLTVERPVWRLNWNLMDDDALFQPVRLGPPGGGVTAENAGDRLWLRVERQTLRRLPGTGAIAFGIRVHQRPLAAVAHEPGVLDTLRSAVAALPPETAEYKGLRGITDAIEAWIDRQNSRSTFDSIPRSSS